MQHLRLLMLMTFVCSWLNFANAASLFGGPKTLPDDGTWSAPSGEKFSNPGGSCEVTCNSSEGYIQVDISTRCMCITNSGCFKIDIGKPGYYTTNGLGKMGRADGELYHTLPGAGDTQKWDQDAISMGITANTGYGKWIHKARDCQGGGQDTIGCVGVPCAKWPEVKRLGLAGKSFQVCKGVNVPTSRNCGVGAVKACWNASLGITPAQVDRQIRAAMSVSRPAEGSGSNQEGRR